MFQVKHWHLYINSFERYFIMFACNKPTLINDCMFDMQFYNGMFISTFQTSQLLRYQLTHTLLTMEPVQLFPVL